MKLTALPVNFMFLVNKGGRAVFKGFDLAGE